MPERTADGSWTLRQRELDEACHSSAGAWLESLERYAVPCRLKQVASRQERVRLLDVGTGLGLNIAAALHELEGCVGALDVVTLEIDRTVIEATLALATIGATHASEREHAVVRAALSTALDAASDGGAVALGANGTLRLLLGDARETLAQLPATLEAFDAVFLDPFSPRRAPELWSEAFLSDVARRMAPRAILSTYSAAFGVRRALAATGLRVGAGPRVGAKAEGTLASLTAELPALPERVTRRLRNRT